MSPWIAVAVIVTILFYAILSVLLRKPIGLFIAAALHIIMGILSLPSIGLYVLGLATLELVTGIVMSVKKASS